MATTTNYGWVTPDDTDLVKDGAAAIRTLGSSADTTTKNLNPETTLGDLSFRSSTSDVNTRIGIGTSGQVLLVSGGIPAWGTATGGGLTLISEQAVSAVSSVTFSGIAQTFKQLHLVWYGIRASNNSSSFSIRLNNDANTVYRANFPGNASSTLTNEDGNFTHIGSTNFPAYGLNGNSSQVRDDGAGYLILDNYASTTRPKNITANFWFQDTTVARKYAAYRGVYDDLTAISSIDIVRLSGAGTITNNNNSSIRLYGLS